MARDSDQPGRSTRAIAPRLASAAAVVATLCVVWWLAPAALLVAPVEGATALLVVLSGAGWGLWPARLLRGSARRGPREWCVRATLGLGLLAWMTLGLGVAGVLSRAAAWGVVGGGLAILAATRAREQRACMAAPSDSPPAAIPPFAWLMLAPLVVPLAVAICGASLPPGVVWDSEGRGYDALIYHLGGPREYYDAGRISFLPHNVYTSFPQQVEMLSLLLMNLAGGVLPGALAAQWLHAAFGGLAVAALAAWSPSGAPRLVVVALAASTPWIAHLACLAYVELAVLFFAAVAAGVLLERFDGAAAGGARPWRDALAAGLCAGLAGGAKYTALAFVAAALCAAWLIAARADRGTRWRGALAFAAGVVLAFAPWIARNVAFTGNPVFPFAYAWFGGAAWSPEQDAQWARGHRPPPSHDSMTGRLRLARDELLASEMYGPAPKLGGAAAPLALAPLLALGAVALRTAARPAAMLWLWAIFIVATWAMTTHMPGRFALPALAPLLFLAGRGAAAVWQLSGRLGCLTLALFVALVGFSNGATLLRHWRQHDAAWTRLGVRLHELPGQVEVMREAQPLNRALPPDARLLLVGEARVFYLTPRPRYCVVFNRDPWTDATATAPPAEAVAMLSRQGITHVAFVWSEIERLRRTYGFAAHVTPAWVADLERHGLVSVPHELLGEDGPRLYRVPGP